MNFYESRESEFLVRANQIILDNLENEQFDVPAMAWEMDTSLSSLFRKLKAFTGLSASKYIRRIKLEKAHVLLKESSANITEIALLSGFRSVAYFDKCFGEEYGYAPGKVRKELLDKDHEPQSVGDQSETKSNLNNVPVWVTSFIGRKKEIEVILEFLTANRILSLVGSGGSGKTRLASAAVEKLDGEFKDGIWFVDLSSVDAEDLVLKEILITLNIPESPGEEMMDTLIRMIKNKELLIILDNCEHLARTCAEVTGGLVSTVGGLKILVTSRVVLNIQGEKVWRVPSLSQIDSGKVMKADQAKDSEAILLFNDRAQLCEPDFELLDENINEVASICRQLDGIPLAIELVASRIRYMDPAMMLHRLSGKYAELSSPDPRVIERQRTLKTTIDWSYNLLTDEEKLLFQRLSVFSGRFDLIAAEEVCRDRSLSAEYIFDLLSNLVDRSMVNTIRKPGQALRYYLLETLRQYSSELSEEREKNKLSNRHLQYFIHLGEKAYKERLVSQAIWMGKLHLEHDNILSALKWAEENSLAQFAKLAGLVSWFWARSNNYKLGRQVLERIVTRGYARREVKAIVLSGYGWILTAKFDEYAKVIEQLNKSLAIWRRLENKLEEAVLLADLGFVYSGIGDDNTAMKSAKKAYKIAQEENDPGVLLHCMLPVSQGYVNRKIFDEARVMARKILQLAEELENLFGQFMGHHHLADCALMEGKYLEAQKEYMKGVKITASYGDIFYTCIDITGVAMSLAGQGKYAKALRLVSAVSTNAIKAGLFSPEDFQLQFWQEQIQKHIVGSREKVGEELSLKYESEGKTMDLDETISYALEYSP